MPEYKIPELVRMLSEGEIVIPDLQREFVWSNNQARDLAESIYKGYPVGLLTLYKVSPELRTGNERYWVLDGQQRLLSLALLMKGEVEALRKGTLQKKKMDIWFDPRGAEFKLRRPREGENWVRLPELLQIPRAEGLERFLTGKGFDIDEKDKIRALWNLSRGFYALFVHEISEDLDLDDLGNIFVRTNFGGTRVRGSDIYSTMMAITKRELVGDMRNFCTELSKEIEIDYGILIRTFVAFLTDGKVKLASRVLEQANRLKGLLKEKENQISALVQKVKDCVQQAEDVLIKRGIRRSLPTESVIPVMSFYIYKKGRITPEEEEGLFKWLVLASYFKRYSASVETRLDEDLSIVKSGGNCSDLVEKLAEREGNLHERIRNDLERGEWDYWLLFALLRQAQAKDPDSKTGESLNTANIAIHHLFPRKFVIGSEFEDLLNDAGNITLLTPGTNQRIFGELPENYLKWWPQEQRSAHYIPQGQELWKFGEMRNFIEERKKLLKEAAERFLQ